VGEAALKGIGLTMTADAFKTAERRGIRDEQIVWLCEAYKADPGAYRSPGIVKTWIEKIAPEEITAGWRPAGRAAAPDCPTAEQQRAADDIARHTGVWASMSSTQRNAVADRAGVDLATHTGRSLRDLPTEIRTPIVAELLGKSGCDAEATASPRRDSDTGSTRRTSGTVPTGAG